MNDDSFLWEDARNVDMVPVRVYQHAPTVIHLKDTGYA